MLSREEVKDEVTRIAELVLEFPTDEISESARWDDDLGSSSVAIVEMVVELDRRFNLQIPLEDFSRAKTVGDAVDYLCGLIAQST